ncbi:RDD family protein [Candidatus Woesearchaeota archaeon]|nr:RDD family protein [Candidatus Woesearchaeota archaeon]
MKSVIASKKTFVAQASVLKRIGAFIVDLVIINIIILFPFRGLFESILPTTSFSEAFEFLRQDAGAGTMLNAIMFAISALSILYFMLMEKKIAQTPGKMLFSLYVKPQGKDLKNWQLFVRSMFLIPAFPFVLLWLIDPIAMLFTKENQRLSEILSRTKVVEQYRI